MCGEWGEYKLDSSSDIKLVAPGLVGRWLPKGPSDDMVRLDGGGAKSGRVWC